MDLYEALLRPARRRSKAKHNSKARRSGRVLQHELHFGDFDCCHCRLGVSAAALLSGVHNRNHCPFCLWSKHVDLREPGDRLSACKAPMRPAGLTFKRVRKKYAPDGAAGSPPRGELMLVHHCAGCGAISLNRLAADDSPLQIWEVFATSLDQPPALVDAIDVLGPTDGDRVRAMVFGD
jgi:hypothetical protein